MSGSHRPPCVLLLVLGVAMGAHGQTEEPAALPSSYDLSFGATVLPSERVALAEIRLGAGADAVRRISLRLDPARHEDPTADGELEREGDVLHWRPPAGGGALRYRFRIDSVRADSAYDALCAETWALFRAGDLFPPARVRTHVGAESRSVLRLRVPEGWKLAVPWARAGDGSYRIQNPDRRFDRPTGWVALGRLGILRERIAGTSVAVAAPVGQGVPRQDRLALLRFALPKLRDVLGRPMPRLLVVGAGDPMWRGGLSAPGSVYLHAQRPLIARDVTSPLLHEVFHAATRAQSGPGGDWIVEGLAELYSLELLVRSRSISRRRFERALSAIARRAEGVRLEGESSRGASTGRAIGVLRELDARLREATGGESSLDDVVAELTRRRQPVTPELLREVAESASGLDLAGFFGALPIATPRPPSPPPPAGEAPVAQ